MAGLLAGNEIRGMAELCSPEARQSRGRVKKQYGGSKRGSSRNFRIVRERRYHYSMLVLNMVQKAIMETARKITVEVPQELLEKAQRASGVGITQTVRTGLQLVAASRTYARLRRLRGKVRFSRTVAELKADR